jgi:hypothetical protein
MARLCLGLVGILPAGLTLNTASAPLTESSNIEGTEDSFATH